MSQREELVVKAHEAAQLLQEHVFIPVFLQKLASYGIAPTSQDDQDALIKIGYAQLAKAQQSAAARPVSQPSFFKAAAAALLGDSEAQQNIDYAAAHLARQPQFADAMLAVQLSGSAAANAAM